MEQSNTVAIIGGGPVGLAAAAHVLERGLTPVVLEAGPAIGHAMRQWSHVQLFSPWEYNVDKAAERLLAPTGWNSPDPMQYPTGGELLADRALSRLLKQDWPRTIEELEARKPRATAAAAPKSRR